MKKGAVSEGLCIIFASQLKSVGCATHIGAIPEQYRSPTVAIPCLVAESEALESKWVKKMQKEECSMQNARG